MTPFLSRHSLSKQTDSGVGALDETRDSLGSRRSSVAMASAGYVAVGLLSSIYFLVSRKFFLRHSQLRAWLVAIGFSMKVKSIWIVLSMEVKSEYLLVCAELAYRAITVISSAKQGIGQYDIHRPNVAPKWRIRGRAERRQQIMYACGGRLLW
jgi:hypothetical protein